MKQQYAINYAASNFSKLCLIGITLFLCIVPPCFSQAKRGVTVRTLPAKEKRFALIIGVDQYKDKQINSLRGAANDAKSLAEVLVSHAGFPQANVTVLTTDQQEEFQPTRAVIIDRLSKLAAQVSADSFVLFYFAGHGSELNRNGYLWPTDVQTSDLEETSLISGKIREKLTKTGAKQLAVILDACRTEPIAQRGNNTNPMSANFAKAFDFAAHNTDIEAYVTLYSTAIGQGAYEYSEKNQGFFTWALVEGLKGAAANSNGQVTLIKLLQYVEEKVPDLVKRNLGVTREQRPWHSIEGFRAEELVVAVRNSKPTNTNQPPERNPSPTVAPLAERHDPMLTKARDINRNQKSYFSVKEEQSLGKDFAATFERQNPISTDPATRAYLNSIGQKLVETSDAKIPITFKLINSQKISLTILPGGYIYVTKGLIAECQNEAQLAAVFAHALAHLTARHWAEHSQVSKPLDPDAPLSNAEETEANDLAVQYLWLAGYTPMELGNLQKVLDGVKTQKQGMVETQFYLRHIAQVDNFAFANQLVNRFPKRNDLVSNSSAFDAVKREMAGVKPVISQPSLEAATSTPQNIRVQEAPRGPESTRPTAQANVNNYAFTVEKCFKTGAMVTCTLTITNLIQDRNMMAYVSSWSGYSAQAFDDWGNAYLPSKITIANQTAADSHLHNGARDRLENMMVSQVKTPASVTFSGVRLDATKLALLKIALSEQAGRINEIFEIYLYNKVNTRLSYFLLFEVNTARPHTSWQ